MRGRPITNHSIKAQKNREHMRRKRAAEKAQPAQSNPQPLVQALAAWRTQ